MCQSTKDGGKRCGAHANATLAAEMQIAKTTGAPIQKVKQILSMLRKRGKGETAPSAQEIAEYATQQKFNINNDSSLSSHDKRILSNRWDKAMKEEVSGGTWYAIKNGFFAVVAFLKKRAVAGGLVGLMAFTSVAACTGGAQNEVPVPATSSTSAPVNPAPSASPTEAASLFATKNITVGDTVGEGLEKRKELIAGDQSGLLEGVKIPSTVSNVFTQEQIETAQQTAAAFTIEEILDSGYLHESNAQTVAGWYDDIKSDTSGVFTKDLDSLKAKVSAEQYPVPSNIGAWRGVPDAERPTKNGSYYDEVSVTLKEISLLTHEGINYPSFTYSIETKRPVVNTDKTDKKKYDEFMLISAGVTPSEDGSKIAGYSQRSSTRTVEEGGKPDFSS